MYNYLGRENLRNTESREALVVICRRAYGCKVVVIGHHLTVALDSEGHHLEEIPSVDTLLFDTEIAEKLFGDSWRDVLQALAVLPQSERVDYYLRQIEGRCNPEVTQ